MSKFILIRAACLIFITIGFCSQEATAQSRKAVLQVDTNLPEALVYADSAYVGRANQQVLTIPANARTVRLVASSVDSWSIQPISADISPGVDDTISVVLHFPYHYQIESVPFEAQVFLEQPDERMLLGITPLIHTADEPLRGVLLVHKDGFVQKRFSPGESIWNHHRTVLEEDVMLESTAGGHWNPEKRSARWIDYVAGGVALVSGIAAIRFKAKADRRFDRYAISGDPTLRSGFERFDRLAAVSLGTMQVGLGVLAIRLVFD